jgi:hypothetical protein
MVYAEMCARGVSTTPPLLRVVVVVVVWCGVVWCGVVWCGVVWCCCEGGAPLIEMVHLVDPAVEGWK